MSTAYDDTRPCMSWELDAAKIEAMALNGMPIDIIAIETGRKRAACEMWLQQRGVPYVTSGIAKYAYHDTMPISASDRLPLHKNGQRVNYAK